MNMERINRFKVYYRLFSLTLPILTVIPLLINNSLGYDPTLFEPMCFIKSDIHNFPLFVIPFVVSTLAAVIIILRVLWRLRRIYGSYLLPLQSRAIAFIGFFCFSNILRGGLDAWYAYYKSDSYDKALDNYNYCYLNLLYPSSLNTASQVPSIYEPLNHYLCPGKPTDYAPYGYKVAIMCIVCGYGTILFLVYGPFFGRDGILVKWWLKHITSLENGERRDQFLYPGGIHSSRIYSSQRHPSSTYSIEEGAEYYRRMSEEITETKRSLPQIQENGNYNPPPFPPSQTSNSYPITEEEEEEDISMKNTPSSTYSYQSSFYSSYNNSSSNRESEFVERRSSSTSK